MGKLSILAPLDGDKHITWDKKNPKSVEKAKKAFDKHVEKGHKAYKVKQQAVRSGQPVKTFNPDVEEYLLAPAMAGG